MLDCQVCAARAREDLRDDLAQVLPCSSEQSSMILAFEVDLASAQRFSFSIFRLLEEFIKYAQKQKRCRLHAQRRGFYQLLKFPMRLDSNRDTSWASSSITIERASSSGVSPRVERRS